MRTPSTEHRLEELRVLDRKIHRLAAIQATLEWDQETNLPSSAIDERSEQLALVEGLVHELQTSPALGDLTAELSGADLDSDADRALVRLHRREFDRASKLPQELVERQARLVGLAQPTWARARKDNDFGLFAPHLAKLVALARERADLLGWTAHPYDALLEEYEPGTTTAEVKAVFDDLEGGVTRLVRRLAARPQVRNDFLKRSYPRPVQEQLGRQLASDIGFDWNSGRLDVTTHPFCTTLGPRDVRITTRYDESFFNMALYGILHETGHALYEQGINPRYGSSILGSGTSLGIHESQSRFWENFLGRSRPFIDRYFPTFQRAYPDSLGDVDADSFYRGVNLVEPSFIRVEADEVTYSLHILLRFRLETALLDGSLKAEEVPGAWNSQFTKLFGLTPPDDAQGCLQDVHWAMGGLGYFPTYTLGNLYAAQFFDALKLAHPDWATLVRQGQFAPLLGWLRTHIHTHGRVYSAGELCQRATGHALDPRHFLGYLTEKYEAIYEL